MTMKRGNSLVMMAVAACWMVSEVAVAQDVVQLTNGKKVQVRSIRWVESEQAYRVETMEGSMLPLPKAQVQGLSISKPAEYDKAVGLLATKQYAAAIPMLEEIITKYKMLTWDNKARVLLAKAYLAQSEPKKAVSVLEGYMSSVSKAEVPPELIQTYWTALLQSNQNEALKKELDSVVATGTRQMVATAMVMRGNMNRDAGQKEVALLDYLRVVILFENIKEAQPEALYKAAEILEELRDPRADELRKKLVQEYKDSDYAAKLSGKI